MLAEPALIAKTQIPNVVANFLNAYSQRRSNVDQRRRSAHYQSINTAPKPAAKPAPKPPARGVPVLVPAPPPLLDPPPQKPPALHPVPAAVPVGDDLITLTVAVRLQKRCAVTRPWKCWMRKRSWYGVHRVGTDLTAFFASALPAGRNFALAPDVHDFQPVIIRSYQSWAKFRLAFRSLWNWASFSAVLSLLDSSLCF